jgi:hypothetical protein
MSLQEAIDTVQRIYDETRAATPAPQWNGTDMEAAMAASHNYQKAAEDALERIAREYGANFRHNGGDGHYLKLAGVSSSCTSGAWGLMTNWLNAARRKLAKQ